ncbi:MAG: LacI family transcriptional regulator [Actinomycetota bacterium]|nr:LacI family transcriptional regulator [Actinomycetota bacterium]
MSRALDLSKAHLVSSETLTLVRETAKRMGYRGDRVAGALRRGATGTVGVVVADLANPFIAPVIHGIARAIATDHMLAMVVETNDDHEQMESDLDHLLSRRVDAVIVAGARFGDRAVLEAASMHTPVILAVRGLPGCRLPQVLHDDRGGGSLAAQHLLDLGHTRLAELRGPDDVGNFVARHEGFRDVCGRAGAHVIDLLEPSSRPNRAEGERLARLLLEQHERDLPTAVFAHNDLMALGALGVFKKHGLRCPDDVSIVGYNNSPTIDQVDPPLTSVAYPGIEIGRAAGVLAMGIIANDHDATPGSLLASSLIERASTSTPRS